MYQKPELKRYGSFSELTQTGTVGGGDGCIVLDTAGNVVDGNPDDGTFGGGIPRCS